MRILIATDGSPFSETAVKKACEFIKPGTSEVKIVSAFENALPLAMEPAFVPSQYYVQLEEDLKGMAEQNVAKARDIIKEHFGEGVVNVTGEVTLGFADKAIIDAAEQWNADLIVVGSHGRGFWGRLLGSVSNGVVHHAPCSVLVVRRLQQ